MAIGGDCYGALTSLGAAHAHRFETTDPNLPRTVKLNHEANNMVRAYCEVRIRKE